MAHPLAGLPQSVIDHILHQLSPASLSVCSLVCKAWSELPYLYLPRKLLVQAGAQATGILEAGLHRCRQVSTLKFAPQPEVLLFWLCL